MTENIIPTLFQQNMCHVYNICLVITVFVPLVIWFMHKRNSKYISRRRTAIVIQWILEIILSIVLVANIILAISSGASMEYIMTTINTYRGMITTWLIFLLFQFGMTYQFHRKLSERLSQKLVP
jgi:uncharacterized Tic20 family protein